MLIDRQGRCVPSTAVSHLLVWPLSANKHTHSWPHHRQTDTRIHTLSHTHKHSRLPPDLPTLDTVPMGMVTDFSLLPLAVVTQAETIPALRWPTTDLYGFSVPCELWPLHPPNPLCTTAQNCWCLHCCWLWQIECNQTVTAVFVFSWTLSIHHLLQSWLSPDSNPNPWPLTLSQSHHKQPILTMLTWYLGLGLLNYYISPTLSWRPKYL